MTNTNTIAQIDRSLRDLREIRELLLAAEEYQYTAPKHGTGVISEDNHGSLPYADPTGDIVVNEVRSALRAQVQKTEKDVRALGRATHFMNTSLFAKLRPWLTH